MGQESLIYVVDWKTYLKWWAEMWVIIRPGIHRSPERRFQAVWNTSTKARERSPRVWETTRRSKTEVSECLISFRPLHLLWGLVLLSEHKATNSPRAGSSSWKPSMMKCLLPSEEELLRSFAQTGMQGRVRLPPFQVYLVQYLSQSIVVELNKSTNGENSMHYNGIWGKLAQDGERVIDLPEITSLRQLYILPFLNGELGIHDNEIDSELTDWLTDWFFHPTYTFWIPLWWQTLFWVLATQR